VTSSRRKMADHQYDDKEDVRCKTAMAAGVIAATASCEFINTKK